MAQTFPSVIAWIIYCVGQMNTLIVNPLSVETHPNSFGFWSPKEYFRNDCPFPPFEMIEHILHKCLTKLWFSRSFGFKFSKKYVFHVDTVCYLNTGICIFGMKSENCDPLLLKLGMAYNISLVNPCVQNAYTNIFTLGFFSN